MRGYALIAVKQRKTETPFVLNPGRARALTCVVGKLHGVNRVNVEAEKLQREHGALVADVPSHHVRLNTDQEKTKNKDSQHLLIITIPYDKVLLLRHSDVVSGDAMYNPMTFLFGS